MKGVGHLQEFELVEVGVRRDDFRHAVFPHQHGDLNIVEERAPRNGQLSHRLPEDRFVVFRRCQNGQPWRPQQPMDKIQRL